MAMLVKTLQPLLYLINHNRTPIHSIRIIIDHQLLSKQTRGSITQDQHGEEERAPEWAQEQLLKRVMQMATITIKVECVEFYLINGGKHYVRGEQIWMEDMMIRKMEVKLVVPIRLNEPWL